MVDDALLPDNLLRYLPDSEMKVLSWDCIAGILKVRLTKDIGPETGTLQFYRVTHVNMPPHLHSIDRIECANDLPPNYLATYRPDDASLESSERMFLIHGSSGEEYFVVAERVDYRVDD